MINHIELTEDAFSTLFRPKPNHLNPNATCDFGFGFGTLFETYGEEFDFVKQQPLAHIWTWVNGDDGDTIASGFHFVNHVGYFVSETPVPDGVSIEVELEPVDIRELPLLDLLPPMPDSVIAALNRVISHFWHDEERHFYNDVIACSGAAQDAHIFHSLRIARNWIDLAINTRSPKDNAL